jgi:NAD(P)-dependent dehydrogenase (short-subunit alcohol dehydrogenase family)
MNILITGVSRGIGKAIALNLANEGHRIIGVARDQKSLMTFGEEINTGGKNHLIFTSDVSSSAEVKSLIDAIQEQAGSIDVLINNAGTANSAKLEDTSDEIWHKTFAVNVDAAFYLCRALAGEWKQRKRGLIINIASTAALRGFRYTSAYTASKHALLGLSRALDAELSSSNIGIYTICPGFVRTSILESSIENIINRTGKSREAAESDLAAMNAGGKLLEPEDIALVISNILQGTEQRHEIEL